jgi:hypothetical protein
MKRKLLSAILGLAVAPVVFGQGHILISNYVVSPYNQVHWNPTMPGVGNAAVRADQGIVLTLWYGEGVITDPTLLIQGPSFGILSAGGSELYDPGAGHGPGGYYLVPEQVLATWQPGDTFTFQIRASGTTAFGQIGSGSRSVMWQENSAINNASLPANPGTFSAGLMIVDEIIPEPSSLTLAGAALGSLIMFRKARRSNSNTK